MNKLNWLIEQAKNSNFYLWLLNLVAARVVPFNLAHSFRITAITKQSVEIKLPYKKANLNHIKGIHACALATLSEYCTGLVLLSAIDATKYRIILKNINITYHYQAKTAVHAKFELTPEWIEANVLEPLKTSDAVFKEFKIETHDASNNHICTGLINWQIKPWKSVKTV
ncbi:MAG: DUF4442 domain-containing protein [Bacteroidetes bacterium]|nr:DUF4442 domain-containing protein [Bacteroidota bacterium]